MHLYRFDNAFKPDELLHFVSSDFFECDTIQSNRIVYLHVFLFWFNVVFILNDSDKVKVCFRSGEEYMCMSYMRHRMRGFLSACAIHHTISQSVSISNLSIHYLWAKYIDTYPNVPLTFDSILVS